MIIEFVYWIWTHEGDKCEYERIIFVTCIASAIINVTISGILADYLHNSKSKSLHTSYTCRGWNVLAQQVLFTWRNLHHVAQKSK